MLGLRTHLPDPGKPNSGEIGYACLGDMIHYCKHAAIISETT